MFRRVVSLLLLPCMLLTQSAALGHSHGDGQSPGHDLRPHLHTNPAPAGHQHDHVNHHHGPGGHHHHDADVIAPDAPTTPPSQQPEPPSDHDSDAIYVNATDAVAVERSELTGGEASSDWWTATDADFFAKGWADSPAHSVFCGHPPPLSCHLCPLYIRHLALLI